MKQPVTDPTKNFSLHSLPFLAVELPEHATFLRLGGNTTRTMMEQEDANHFRQEMRRAFQLCRCSGVWKWLPVTQRTATAIGFRSTSGDEWVVECEKFVASLTEDVEYLWLGATTIGAALSERIAELTRNDAMADAAICDALGSECADGAMDALQQQARRELARSALALAERRFSPGYGGMELAVQRIFFTELELSETLHLALSERCLMTPEKSVTAFAGVSRVKS